MKVLFSIVWLLFAAMFTVEAQEPKQQKINVVYRKDVDGTSWLATRTGSIHVVYYTMDAGSQIAQISRGSRGGTVVTIKKDSNPAFTLCMPQVYLPDDERSFIFWKRVSSEEFASIIKKIPN